MGVPMGHPQNPPVGHYASPRHTSLRRMGFWGTTVEITYEIRELGRATHQEIPKMGGTGEGTALVPLCHMGNTKIPLNTKIWCKIGGEERERRGKG